MTRPSDRAAITIVVATLAAYAVTRSLAIPSSWHFVTNVAMVGVVAGSARLAGLTAPEAGLSRAALPAGLRVGAVAVVAVGGVVAMWASIAGEGSSFAQDRVGLSTPDMLVQVFVEIPLATVLLEELAFRGVLGPLWHRVTTPWRAVVLTSVVFALWHVPPLVLGSGDPGAPAVLGTVAATFLAGVVFQLLRDGTGSLAAPAAAHWATNGLSLLIVWTVARP